jgi:hypothetical protein
LGKHGTVIEELKRPEIVSDPGPSKLSRIL